MDELEIKIREALQKIEKEKEFKYYGVKTEEELQLKIQEEIEEGFK